ncbi:hypothetical protein K8R62_03645 [bacterium]|nr:hypothetical protein [bacterium]
MKKDRGLCLIPKAFPSGLEVKKTKIIKNDIIRICLKGRTMSIFRPNEPKYNIFFNSGYGSGLDDKISINFIDKFNIPNLTRFLNLFLFTSEELSVRLERGDDKELEFKVI